MNSTKYSMHAVTSIEGCWHTDHAQQREQLKTIPGFSSANADFWQSAEEMWLNAGSMQFVCTFILTLLFVVHERVLHNNSHTFTQWIGTVFSSPSVNLRKSKWAIHTTTASLSPSVLTLWTDFVLQRDSDAVKEGEVYSKGYNLWHQDTFKAIVLW